MPTVQPRSAAPTAATACVTTAAAQPIQVVTQHEQTRANAPERWAARKCGTCDEDEESESEQEEESESEEEHARKRKPAAQRRYTSEPAYKSTKRAVGSKAAAPDCSCVRASLLGLNFNDGECDMSVCHR